MNKFYYTNKYECLFIYKIYYQYEDNKKNVFSIFICPKSKIMLFFLYAYAKSRTQIISAVYYNGWSYETMHTLIPTIIRNM